MPLVPLRKRDPQGPPQHARHRPSRPNFRAPASAPDRHLRLTALLALLWTPWRLQRLSCGHRGGAGHLALSSGASCWLFCAAVSEIPARCSRQWRARAVTCGAGSRQACPGPYRAAWPPQGKRRGRSMPPLQPAGAPAHLPPPPALPPCRLPGGPGLPGAASDCQHPRHGRLPAHDHEHIRWHAACGHHLRGRLGQRRWDRPAAGCTAPLSPGAAIPPAAIGCHAWLGAGATCASCAPRAARRTSRMPHTPNAPSPCHSMRCSAGHPHSQRLPRCRRPAL